MPFTSSHLFLTKEAYYYLEANANKGHQETLSSQTPNAVSSRKGWFFIGSHLIKEMLIRGAFGPGLKLRRSPGCQWGPQAPPQKNRRAWGGDSGRAQSPWGREEGAATSATLRPAVRGGGEPRAVGCCSFILTEWVFVTELKSLASPIFTAQIQLSKMLLRSQGWFPLVVPASVPKCNISPWKTVF